MTDYIGQAAPSRIVRASGTTMFHLAAKYLGDPLQWERIARLNNLVDPWLVIEQEIKIPTAGVSNGGILY